MGFEFHPQLNQKKEDAAKKLKSWRYQRLDELRANPPRPPHENL